MTGTGADPPVENEVSPVCRRLTYLQRSTTGRGQPIFLTESGGSKLVEGYMSLMLAVAVVARQDE